MSSQAKHKREGFRKIIKSGSNLWLLIIRLEITVLLIKNIKKIKYGTSYWKYININV